jgi:hypothetical protein
MEIIVAFLGNGNYINTLPARLKDISAININF